jgi:hypothetical protein
MAATAHGPEQLREQLSLGGPVAVQRAGREARPLGDRDHRGGAVTALLDQLLSRLQQALASPGGDGVQGFNL